jgi:hypothetical protein
MLCIWAIHSICCFVFRVHFSAGIRWFMPIFRYEFSLECALKRMYNVHLTLKFFVVVLVADLFSFLKLILLPNVEVAFCSNSCVFFMFNNTWLISLASDGSYVVHLLSLFSIRGNARVLTLHCFTNI